ncbi:MAG: hypothetical protein WCB68_00210 [Pyrinomonadaceae bacterium]
MSIKAVFLILLSCLMVVAVTIRVQARPMKDKTFPQTRSARRQTSKPVIVFGHTGGNLRPYKVAIYADGRVSALEGAPPLDTKQIPAEKVTELVQQASDKNFWKFQGDQSAEKVLPDFGFVFVKVRTPARSSRFINHSGRGVGPLGEFYQQLSDLVFIKP